MRWELYYSLVSQGSNTVLWLVSTKEELSNILYHSRRPQLIKHEDNPKEPLFEKVTADFTLGTWRYITILENTDSFLPHRPHLGFSNELWNTYYNCKLTARGCSFLVRGNLISPLPSLSSMVRNVLLFFFLI